MLRVGVSVTCVFKSLALDAYALHTTTHHTPGDMLTASFLPFSPSIVADGCGSGGIKGQMALRQSFVFLNMPSLNNPEFVLGGAGDKFNADGTLKDAKTVDFLRGYMQNLVNLATLHKVAQPKL